MTQNISYARSKDVLQGFDGLLCRLIDESGAKRICDIGGGSNPALSPDYVRSRALHCTLLDISREELQKAPDEYTKVVQDIRQPNRELFGRFDLVFSRMVAEHVEDGRQFHRNVFSMLREGGMAVHLFPTLYAFPYVVNRVLPEWLSCFVINHFAPRGDRDNWKWPAHYSWCRGPSKSNVARLEALGYEIVDYMGLFGHGGYYRKIRFVKPIHERITSFMLTHPSPHLTSYACVVLRKRRGEIPVRCSVPLPL